VDKIRVPTLIMHGKDDPFIPYSQIERPEVASNPNIAVLAPDNGGHVGFVAAEVDGEDRFWAERTTIRFVELIRL